jgi:uncharacterized protein YjdB
MKRLTVLPVLVLAIVVSFVNTATVNAQTLPVCKTGADPVDPTYTWVPPADWKLIKTDKPFDITETGGHGEYQCTLGAGEVLGYPPGGGNPLVVRCKNEITKGRPTGTEIPREKLAEALPPLVIVKNEIMVPPANVTVNAPSLDGIIASIDRVAAAVAAKDKPVPWSPTKKTVVIGGAVVVIVVVAILASSSHSPHHQGPGVGTDPATKP